MKWEIKTRSAKTLPLLPTTKEYAESCQNTTHNDHPKKEKIEPYTKIRIEQKALSSLQNYVQIQLHS